MIDTKALRNRILDLAIQGKLTEQLESDGTDEELYQQIQEEKNKILFERKGRKDNSIKPLDEDVPFEIPNNWKWIRFGETGFFRKGPFGSSLTKSMFVPKSENTIKVYEQQHAIKKDYSLGKYYITKEYFDSTMSGFEVVTGDIIISCAGTIGETYIMPINIEKGIINQALMRVTVVPSIDKQFFLYYFNANLKQNAKEESNGSAITNIPPFDVLKNWYFPLPPLAEQKRIVQRVEEIFSVLDTIDEAQEKYSADVEILKVKLIIAGIKGKLTQKLESDGTAEELYQQIQEEKQKLIKDGKIKKEKPLPPIKGEEIPFEIPKNWKWVRLRNIFTLQAGKNITASQISETQDSIHQYKCFGGNGIRGYVSDYNTIGEHALIGRQGALCGNINFAKDKFYATEHAVVVYQYCDMNVNWIVFALKELNLNQYATSVAQPGLAVSKIDNVLIPLPPFAEQKRIAEKLGELLGALE